jgi:hypothetical protein
MNLGQLLLVVLALALLATAQLLINSSILRATVVSLDSEARVNAISVGQSLVDEINSKLFDDSLRSKNRLYYLTQLTPANRLGQDAGDQSVPTPDRNPFVSQTAFNDVDDYNGYSRIDSSYHLGPFYVSTRVFYVQGANFETVSSMPTWYKKIVVTVKHPNLARQLVMNASTSDMDSIVVKSLSVYREYF